MIRLILTILLLATTAQAQEAGLDYIGDGSDNSRIILNDQLRRTSRRLRNIEDGININDDTSGILTRDKGGTAADLSTTIKGALIYDNGSTFDQISPATTTTGYYLQSNGTGQAPSYSQVVIPDNVWTYVGDDSFTTSSNVSITETIAAGETYRIIYEGTTSGSDFGPSIRVDSDSAGQNYDYMLQTIYSDGANSATNVIDAYSNQDEVALIDGSIGVITGDTFILQLTITARNTDTQFEWILSVTDVAGPAAGGRYNRSTGVGIYNDGTPSSIQFIRTSGTDTITGHYYIHKLNQP